MRGARAATRETLRNRSAALGSGTRPRAPARRRSRKNGLGTTRSGSWRKFTHHTCTSSLIRGHAGSPSRYGLARADGSVSIALTIQPFDLRRSVPRPPRLTSFPRPAKILRRPPTLLSRMRHRSPWSALQAGGDSPQFSGGQQGPNDCRRYAIVDEAMIREAAVKMDRGAKVRQTTAQRTAQSDRPSADR